MGRIEDLNVNVDGRAHPVTVSNFWMQQHEVTIDEYRRFDPTHKFPRAEGRYATGSSQTRGRYPAEPVSWYEAFAYATWLGGSLPTEAQWEYAARGTAQRQPAMNLQGRVYPCSNDPPTVARFSAPVMSKTGGQTPEGIDDMCSNVSEWCRDWYDRYAEAEQLDPLGPATPPEPGGPASSFQGRLRVMRAGVGRATDRGSGEPQSDHDIGFRVVASRLRF
jgi:sulfatase modifying factor 1